MPWDPELVQLLQRQLLTLDRQWSDPPDDIDIIIQSATLRAILMPDAGKGTL